MNKNKQYAFWEYSHFPYFLGGTVTGYSSDNLVKTKEFGGYYFKPVKFTSIEKGRAIRGRLEALANERLKAIKVLDEGYKTQLNHILQCLNM